MMLRLLAFHREIQEEVFGLVRKATLQRLAEKSYASNLKITSVSLMGILSLLQGPLREDGTLEDFEFDCDCS